MRRLIHILNAYNYNMYYILLTASRISVLDIILSRAIVFRFCHVCILQCSTFLHSHQITHPHIRHRIIFDNRSNYYCIIIFVKYCRIPAGYYWITDRLKKIYFSYSPEINRNDDNNMRVCIAFFYEYFGVYLLFYLLNLLITINN